MYKERLYLTNNTNAPRFEVRLFDGLQSLQKDIGDMKQDRFGLPYNMLLVVDILRATSTMAYLFRVGAKTIVLPPANCNNMEVNQLAMNKQHRVSLGSDHVGEVVFDYPNSPYDVIKAREALTGKTVIMSTSKGGKVPGLMTNHVWDSIVFGSIPGMSYLIRYIQFLRNYVPLRLVIASTERSSHGGRTEDYVFSMELLKLLWSNGELGLKLDDFLSVRGMRRFYRDSSIFDHRDVVLSIHQPTTLFDFLVSGRLKDGFTLIERKSIESMISDRLRLMFRKRVLAYKELRVLSLGIESVCSELSYETILRNMSRSFTKEGRRLLLHVYGLMHIMLEIGRRNGLDVRDVDYGLLLAFYHDSVKLLSLAKRKQLASRLGLKTTSHSAIIHKIFRAIGENEAAEAIKHNSPDFLSAQVKTRNWMVPHLLLNIADRLDVSGRKISFDKKKDLVLGRSGIDVQAEHLAFNVLGSMFDDKLLVFKSQGRRFIK